MPLAALLVASAYWLALQIGDHATEQHKTRSQRVKLSDRHAEFVLPATAPSGNKFLYDLWWGHISPDTEFPKDVRRVLNSAFGELAMRAQQVDLKRMLLT